MRYLNKIVLINSASVKYAEIDLDGNVHLIGTQGVGKSTLLRAILFFYNANKIKLGIPREKKGFDDYYFAYQNSYIIYEIVKNGVPFCVLAYKVNGKVAFRFFDSPYKRDLFIDDSGRAYASWDNIRNAFGRHIHYSSLITSYEDFRKIIYGDNQGLKPDFRKYALIESKQFQNIPRTIQNVFLNSNLEAKFIKDTIINSLDDDEFVIDIENYAKNHLRDFETQINDIKVWFKENRKGQVTVRNQADRVIDKYRHYKFLNREKKEFASDLISRMGFIEREKPVLSSDYSREHEVLNELISQKENLKVIHKRREQKIISEIEYLKKELTKAKDKRAEYDNLKISEIIERVAQKDTLTNEQTSLNEEKSLLTSQFSEISRKYEALISQVQIKQQQFKNNQEAKINKLNAEFAQTREAITATYQDLINQINADHDQEKDIANNELNSIIQKEYKVKNKRTELKHKVFFSGEIEKCKTETSALDAVISKAKDKIENSKNTITTTRREWELEVKELERTNLIEIEKETENHQKVSDKIHAIETKIKQSESSLYGWLNDNYPNWKNTIGKVVDQENVLFNTELNPKLVDGKPASLFGVELNLSTLSNRVKTVKEYRQDIEGYKKQLKAVQDKILELNASKDTELQKLKARFNKGIKQLNDSIAESEYIITQSEQKLKKNKIDLDQWTVKAREEKAKITVQLENELEKLASEKEKAQSNLSNLKSGIKRKITLKENERNAETATAEKVKNDKTTRIESSISENKASSEQRIGELKIEQSGELDNKGANTTRLNEIEVELTKIQSELDYIKDNQRKVFDYEKDKRELFDRVPQLKADRLSVEKRQSHIVEDHKIELEKINTKCFNQEAHVKAIKSKLDDFELDLTEFEKFSKSDIYTAIQGDLSDEEVELEVTKTAISIISEIRDKYYKGIDTFKELQQATNAFTGNFNEHNIFSFKVKFNEDSDYLNFAFKLKEFVEEDKINEYEKRVNERFSNIIHLIGRETTELNSKEAEIEKIIKKINDDFVSKNFVQAIKEMEMRTQKSTNPIVKLLVKIKEFNDENSLILGETNLFTSAQSNSKNQKAVELLKQLVKELERTKSTTLTLSESFDLQFRIVENDNDSGWVEKLSNVGSEGTDVLVKAMINILLLNVFKDNASRKFKDFKVHCMMDEIGKLHPNNVKGILRFANERNILLINGSPTSQNATDYKYTYKLAKEQSQTDNKKYITKVNRLVKVNPKVLT
ncbi:hypothetical protein I215_13912 [Galbibacter marinus]|uniref:ATP-binding protein n=1 Tax=Galbibacter marinus TaxID=555500 RepID=K2PNQ4_9FLAO|nr:ATP-binding protein [Galbibacter marinus]EKF54165.1 hypothetical protein I215_13912 [Galbibacter marinus]